MTLKLLTSDYRIEASKMYKQDLLNIIFSIIFFLLNKLQSVESDRGGLRNSSAFL